MDDAVANAHTVAIIYSPNTPDAPWQKLEISASIWNSVNQAGGRVIVLTYGQVTLPPILGSHVYGKLDPLNYKQTLEQLCREIARHKSQTSLIYDALREDSSNPFWRVRAEYFDDELPTLLATSFSPPDAAKLRILEEMKPCFLEGSRGTGKTMLLLSLRARVLAARTDSSKGIQELFGCYVRLDRGAFSNAGIHLRNGALSLMDSTKLAQLTDVFAQEFYIGIVASLVSEIVYCSRHCVLSIATNDEVQFVRSIATTLYSSSDPPEIHDLDELIDHLAVMHRQLSGFVKRRFIYHDDAPVPFTCFDLDLFKQVTSLVRRHFAPLERTQITVLLDEYENLLEYQKTVVNGLIKLGPPGFSVKVARKVGTHEVSATTVGQELQETHDYNRIPLIYSVEDKADLSRYVQLLDNFVQRLLASHDLPTIELQSLLPIFESEEVAGDELATQVLGLLQVTQTEYDRWPSAKRKAKFTYYREAATYRCLYGRPGRRTKKRFSGPRELSLISSGVIRFFQEILGMAYHLQSHSDAGFSGKIEPKYQSEAIYSVSDHNLATISRNIEKHGERLKYLLLDLGDCLRQKLLWHSSEPESASIAVVDPHVLRTEKYQGVQEMLNLGVKEGVFLPVDGRSGVRPKHVEDPQPVEVNIARIFAPALEISPRFRWKTRLRCDDLLGLLDENMRRSARAAIIDGLLGRRRGRKRDMGNLSLGFGGDSR